VSVEFIWRFKGLDRPAVIIVGISKEMDDALKYVAMTRARRVLVLIGEKLGFESP
jgi:ATP-dependent exoDNAse (exonuclease V) alpha subunit